MCEVVYLQSLEGDVFEVNRQNAIAGSSVLAELVSSADEGGDEEESNEPIPLFAVHSPELLKISQMLNNDPSLPCLAENAHNCERFIDLIEAASFLQFEKLLDELSNLTVKNIRNKRPEMLCAEWGIDFSMLDEETYYMLTDHCPWLLPLDSNHWIGEGDAMPPMNDPWARRLNF